MRIFVDDLWLVFERGVHIDDLAGQRRVKIGYGLDGLDRTERLPLFELRAAVWKLDVHNVSKLLLGVIRNANFGAISRQFDPLVIFCVLEGGRVWHR